jgi:hypothetical protein
MELLLDQPGAANAEGGADARAASAEPPQKPATIALVDDNSYQRRAYTDALRRRGGQMNRPVPSENSVLHCSCGPTLVSMVQSANPWKCDDLPEFALVHRSRLGRILLKRKMRPGAIVVPPVVRKDLAEMPLVENDYVAQISRRKDPMNRSASAFCHRERGAIGTSWRPSPSTRRLK